MKKDLCEIILVLDESGSMGSCKKATISGVNEFLDNQKRIEGEVNVTLVKFSDYYKVVNNAIPLDRVEYLNEKNYTPSFQTALLDAVGKTIDNTGRRLAETAEKERPERVIFTIITDGFENASVEYSRKQVFELVSRQRNIYNWQFLFLGADIDAWGEEIGISHNVNISKENLSMAFKGASLFALKSRINNLFDSTDDFKLTGEEMDKELDDLE